jgi:hypothetical protein
MIILFFTLIIFFNNYDSTIFYLFYFIIYLHKFNFHHFLPSKVIFYAILLIIKFCFNIIPVIFLILF